MVRTGAPWVVYLVAGTAVSAVAMALPAGAPLDVLSVAVAASGAVALLVGVRWHRPDAPGAWYLLVAGMVTWTLGGAAHAWMAAPGTHDSVTWGDVAYLATYPLVAVGSVVFARSRSRGSGGRQTTALLDTAILTVGAGLLSWVFLIEPGLRSSENAAERLFAVAFPLGNVLIFGALVRLWIAPGRGRTLSGALAAVIGTMLAIEGVARAVTGVEVVDVHPAELDPRWLVAYVLAGAAGLHPSMRLLSAPASPRSETHDPAHVVGLAGALLIGPAILGGQLIVGAELSAAAVVVASTALGLLVMLRMLRMLDDEHHHATTDHLTGLPNRRALYEDARNRLQDADHAQVLLMLDMDGFKEVNDSLGHNAGDDLLVQVGGRLAAHLAPQDLLVRLGGDEFAVLAPAPDGDHALELGRRLSAALREPFVVRDIAVPGTVSIGAALFPEHGRDLSALLRKADIAMYRSKATGLPHLYDEADDDGAARLLLATELRAALAYDELVVHYQPKVCLTSGDVCGVEALVRWPHPVRGLLLPGAFLEVVEESGLMGALTRSVLRLALDQAVVWRAEGRDLTIAVNLSASSLVDSKLPDGVATMLAERGLPAAVIQLEITEDFLMADRDRARAVLLRLRESGVQIAVDDFGTGYSSLAYLRDLPIDELKLDRSFVGPMASDSRAAALVASTIDLAHSLDLRMVAEGVEDSAVYDELIRLGCDQAQGWFLTPALPAEELEAWLAERDGTAVTAEAAV